MGKHVDSPNRVEPVTHLPVYEKVENEAVKDRFLELGNISPKVTQSREKVVKDSEVANGANPLSQKRHRFNLIIKAVYYLKSLMRHSKKSNQFFYKEEQRKYELELQLKKQWPYELVNSSFITRRDL